MRDPFFDREEMGFAAVVPSQKLTDGKQCRYYDENESGIASCRRATGIGWLSFCCDLLVGVLLQEVIMVSQGRAIICILSSVCFLIPKVNDKM